MALDFAALSCYNAAMTLTPKQVLAAAADDCAEHWCQVTMTDDEGNHCMLGAINVAAGVPASIYEFAGYTDVPAELRELRNSACQLLIDKGIVPKTYGSLNTEEMLTMSIYSFNDCSDQATVVAALRKGAE